MSCHFYNFNISFRLGMFDHVKRSNTLNTVFILSFNDSKILVNSRNQKRARRSYDDVHI